LDSYALLNPNTTLILNLLQFIFVNEPFQINLGMLNSRLVQNNFVLIKTLGTLPVVVPTPAKCFALAVNDHSMRLTRSHVHDWSIVLSVLHHCLQPLRRPRRVVDVAEINTNIQVYDSTEEMDFLYRIWSQSFQKAQSL
jgi:hypothetical protein